MKALYVIIAGILVLAGGYYALNKDSAPIGASDVLLAKSLEGLELSEEYRNDKYNINFRYPTGYRTSFVQGDKDILVVANSDSTIGFQIEIQQIDEDIAVLTEQRIRQDLPDIKIESPQDVIIGESGKGLAFLSDDHAFDGKSREVWFVYNKVLYQIRTYAKFDPLIQKILQSWQFE